MRRIKSLCLAGVVGLLALGAAAADRVTIMTAVFLMMLFGDAQVVPESGPYWFLNASRTFSSSSRLEMRTCLGFEPSWGPTMPAASSWSITRPGLA